MNTAQGKSNKKDTKKLPLWMEKRMREIAREEILKWHRENQPKLSSSI